MTTHRDPAALSIGPLFHQLLDDGRAYVRAEADVVKATARARVGSAKSAIAVGIAAIFLVQAGLTVLFMALGSAFALLLPSWAGLLLAALIALAVAALMIRYAAAHFVPRTTPDDTGDPS